ncbi:endo-beta-N-acetylglucosaminidase [Flavivirga rizhaonensis]|uniref:T9SS type A sorting domain-containing protein n=1 Tax=Flavivirga rizhaonensis TaxID=2559571 RepID=A0A4V3P4N2_9FLAO|nr:T9SS type A sorting domain-containing protein [Flavivirga rizhaonensis]TGV02114.1 T9SS type A sorting domain-containing protein [Flavivirga rizhaonensis]
MLKKIFLFILFLNLTVHAQIVNTSPYILTVDELKVWSQNDPTADPSLIATEPLATRFINESTQFNPLLSNAMEIAYLPDGMNNFANYNGEQSQFNLYNFTQWAYIDKLIWFGGTSNQTIQLPSSPWVNTAHKNGVKVFGNVFFAPNIFGGTTETLLNFLEQDVNGDFVVIPIMIDIMEYYKFDGWFINEETNTDSNTAALMYAFLRDLTEQTEALGKEVMWYDAMLLTGTVDWQDRLNANNSPFIQNNEDGEAGNGFEQRVSSNMFINFSWFGTTFPIASKNRAIEINRSKFEVFTGVDLWPFRNQGNFETVGNSWMGWLFEDIATPRTSLGLFAPNCIYNNSQYSNFNTDSSDYLNFYDQERHLFSGANRNPAVEDSDGFKGFSHWIPATSSITQIPFESNFNTGHGLKKFSDGNEISSAPWHNMNEQDILPTWQFAFSENTLLKGSWDFNLAYQGGNSLLVEGDLLASTPIDLELYKTRLLLTENSKIDIIYNYDLVENSQVEVLLTFNDAINQPIILDVSPNGNRGWILNTKLLSAFNGRTLAKIGLRFTSNNTIVNYKLNIGTIKVHEGAPLSVTEHSSLDDTIVISYPKDVENVIHIYFLDTNKNLDAKLFNLQSQLINNFKIQSENVFDIHTSTLSKGIYILNFKNSFGHEASKKIIIR